MMEATNVTIHGLRYRLSDGIPVEEAIRQFLDFVGGRPLVGYYLEYDVAMVKRQIPEAHARHPVAAKQIEVSSVYYRQEMKEK